MRADRIAAVLLAAGALLYLLPLRAYGLAVSDDGWWLVPVLWMRDGEILYRDVWTYYAPLVHHVYAWLFAVTEPSVIAARTLMAFEITAAALLAQRFTRRFAPVSLAWLPGAVYVLMPGPWHKAFYGLVSVAFFVLLARAFEKPRALRFAALGAMAGATLASRQDLGLAQLAIAFTAAALPAFGVTLAGARPAIAPLLAPTFVGAAAVIGPFVAYYGSHGALGDLVEAVFVRAAAQADAFPPALPQLLALDAAEGRGVALVMLAPLVIALLFAIDLVSRLVRRGLDTDVALRGALLAYVLATLGQAYHPVLIVRLLQSALCLYVLATILLADAAARRTGGARRAVVFGGVAAAAGYVAFVLVGIPKVRPSDLYTGSIRARSFATPVEMFGETLYAGPGQADEIRLARDFFASRTRPGEPIVVLPFHLLYYALLDRPSAIRFLADHAHGNFVMTFEQKQVEAERLDASETRYALVEQAWFSAGGAEDPFRNLLAERFHPVRAYRSMMVLERGARPSTPALVAILRRMWEKTADATDLDALRSIADAEPDNALVWKLRGSLAASAGAVDEAIDANQRAAALDPADAMPLERAAELLLQQGRHDEAADDVEQARKIRDSAKLRELAAALAARGE